MQADVADGINQLISAAIIDPEAKGGLRWPPGKESIDCRFFIVSIWHTKHKILSRDKIRVDLRKAGRFDFTTSTGEDVNDVSLKLRGLSEILTVSLLSLRLLQIITNILSFFANGTYIDVCCN